MKGRSLRPVIEGRNTAWREAVFAEVARGGRMVRTAEAKYIVYPNDPVVQLFDWRTDAAESRNVATESKYAGTLEGHRRLLKDWESRLDIARG